MGTSESKKVASKTDKEERKTTSAAEKKEEKSSEKEKTEIPSSSSSSSAPKEEKEKDVWVSNLSSTTRATDLKAIFTKYGNVVGAKVMTNPKIPGSKCYGLVTMLTVEDAERCIKNLNRTEIHGKTITAEKAKFTQGSQSSI